MDEEKKIDVSEISEGGGNTDPPPRRARAWCFTYNNYKADTKEIIIDAVKRRGWEYVIGEEVAPTTGTKHLQGYIRAKCQTTFKIIKQLLGTAHITAAKGTPGQNLAYCSKGGVFESNITARNTGVKATKGSIMAKQLAEECKATYTGVVWRPWQQRILNITSGKPDERKIYWIWDANGNTGKSYLAKYMALHIPGVVIGNGRAVDIYHQVNVMINENGIKPTILLIDIPRVNAAKCSMQAVEKIKDGMFQSSKFEGGRCLYPPPHVVVFSNAAPVRDTLSRDRWEVTDVTDYNNVSDEVMDAI